MTYGQPTVEAGPPRSAVHPTQQHSVHQTQSAHPPQPMGGQVGLQPQRSFSSSEEERSTPECASDEPDESEKGESMLDSCFCCCFFFTSSFFFNRLQERDPCFNLVAGMQLSRQQFSSTVIFLLIQL